MHKGAFTLVNFAHDFALSLHLLLNFFFITKCASLVRNRANVNEPSGQKKIFTLAKFVGETVGKLGITKMPTLLP
jgi:hypothetical protein